MSAIDISRRTVGVNFTATGEADINIWAPHAKQVSLYNESNGTRTVLAVNEMGNWTAKTMAINPGDYYKIILDDKPFPDPYSLSQPDGVHNHSAALNLSGYHWHDQQWQNPPMHQYVIYELHTGTFSPDGTFDGIAARLDHLLSLGITAIELMPVAQFPGSRNWGYDGVFPYAVQTSYGGPVGLQRLVDRCHEKGIAVILDVVYNHLGPEGNYLPQFGPFFTNKYNTPWGNAINFDDEYCDGVRQYFIENTLMWFRDFHVDALRLDAVHAIKDFSPKHILREIKEHVNQLMAATGRQHHLILELDLNDNKFINPLQQHGYGMDAQWIDEFHHALRVAAGEPRTGYYSDFNGLPDLAKAYRDAYVFDGQYSPHRKRIFGVKADENPGEQFIVFSQNHDQVGNRMLGERTSQLISAGLQKLLATAVVTSPYIPMLFMGEEYAETNPFQYFVSHTDPALAEAVRNGRKAEFAAFHAEGEAPDPVAEDTFQHSKLQWQLVSEPRHAAMLDFYKTLLALRRQEAALYTLNRHQLNVALDKAREAIVLTRWHGNERIVTIMNFSKQPQQIGLPQYEAPWQKLFDTNDTRWCNGEPANELTPDGSVFLQPQSALLVKYAGS